MLAKLERVPFDLGKVLYEAGTSPRHVYFPNDSMVSLIGMIAMTQEFLAHMLGTRRSTVNAAAGALQRAGLITYSRGIIVISDRERLRAAACSCYEGIRRLTARVPGLARPSSGFQH